MLTQEIKGNLAKLLATENLVVEHRSTSTASFDVDNRILTLPKWDRASATVYDLLVGHEVGHALYTPKWGNFKCPKDYVNVTEDARIEKLMKRRYPGLRKSFFNGYRELNDSDFFGIADENIDTFKFIDRINLYFKIGVAEVDIPFTEEEKKLVDKVDALETFDEAVAVAEEIWEFAKAEQKQLEKMANVPQSGGDGGSDESETQSTDAEEPEQQTEDSGEGSPGEEDSSEETDLEMPGSGGGELSESETQSNFDSQTQELSSRSFGRTTYVDIPTFDTSDYVVDWETIHDWIAECSPEDKDVYHWVDSEYKTFKKSIQKEVNYLVKEFECKKAAESYSRSMTSRSGVLDCSKLHTYKFNDDLFKKVTTLPEGKNHGMLFILDWSGSMGTTMLATIKQLIILCMFCKKVQIPFEVYAFTNEWVGAERAMSNTTDENDLRREYYNDRQFLKKNELYVSKSYFRMMNIFSSRSNSKNWERQCLNIWREVYAMCMYVGYQQTIGMGLSGTPLNESIVIMKHIIPQFQKTSGVSKINLCILTDGEGCSSGYGAEVQYHDEEPHIVGRRIDGGDVILRDRKIGRTYNYQSGWSEQTNVFIQNLKESNPNVSVMGIRLLDGGSGLSTFYRRYCVDSVDGMDKLYKDWKKTKSVILPNPLAYDALYVMSAKNNSSSSTEMEVEAGSSKTQVRAAFRKMLKQKQTNKQVLNHFISQIA